MSALSVVPANQLTLTANAPPDGAILRSQLIGLSKAVMHTETSDLHKVYANLQLAGITSSWLSREAWHKVTNAKELTAIMEEYVHDLSLRLFPTH
jgi:hypothetical protein